MIFINQIPTINCPGIYSFEVVFGYSEPIFKALAKIQKEGNGQYRKKIKKWEFPISSLSLLLDTLTQYDDITLNFLEEQKENKEIEPNLKYKTKPYPYQIEGIKYGLNHDKFLLLDVPGLGKTLQAIYIAQELKEKENIEHCLIICGINTLKTNWKKEIQRHSNLDSIILGEKVNKSGKTTFQGLEYRISQLKEKIKEFFVIVNVESLRNEKLVKQLCEGPNKFDMIVFDEVHCAKNIQSEQSKGFMKLTQAKHKIAMTGTLLMNDPMDLYVPLRWIEKEKSTFTNFRYFYCKYGGAFGQEFLGYKNLDVLKEQLSTCSLRRTKDLLDLPEKNIIVEYVDMDDKQQKFYENIKKGIKDQVNKVKLNTANLLAMATRLRQATVCPSVLTTENIPSAKVERAADLVKQVVESGSKVVIFSLYKETIYKLQERLKEYKPLIGTGDLKDEEISRNIDKFQNEDENKVFLGTFSKCGTGITLTKANYMIFMDSCWTSAANTQAEDRIHRIGSTQPVFIYYLITNNTIDQHVYDIVQDKSILSDYIIDDEIPNEAFERLKKIIEEIE